MEHRTFRIYDENDFIRITNGIQVARCMRPKSSLGELSLMILPDFIIYSHTYDFFATVLRYQPSNKLSIFVQAATIFV